VKPRLPIVMTPEPTLIAPVNQAPAPALRMMSERASLASLLSPISMAKSLYSLREIVIRFSERELLSRNKGSALGFIWTVLQPLLMLAVYTFVFAVVWQAKWGVGGAAAGESNATFALSVFCGLIMFDLFAATVGASAAIVVNNANYVKKVIFPLEALPLAQLGAGLCTFAISLLILLTGNFFFGSGLSKTVYFVPLVLLPMVALAAGVAWFVASLGVYLRDLRQLVSGLLLPVLFFVTPVFYPSERVPAAFAWILAINPLAGLVENARRVMLYGQMPDWPSLITVAVVSLLAMQLGYAFFMKSKRSFADVL